MRKPNSHLGNLCANSAELRIWLPVPAKAAMEECTAEMQVRTAKYLRELLVVYLYGAHELLRMKAEDAGLYYIPPPPPPSNSPPSSSGGIMFSRAQAVECIPGLGKNIVPIKLFLHEKMKADLESLAKEAGIPLGQFVREILVSHFLGHTVWPERKQSWSAAQQKIADDWADGRIENQGAEDHSGEEDEVLEAKVENMRW